MYEALALEAGKSEKSASQKDQTRGLSTNYEVRSTNIGVPYSYFVPRNSYLSWLFQVQPLFLRPAGKFWVRFDVTTDQRPQTTNRFPVP